VIGDLLGGTVTAAFLASAAACPVARLVPGSPGEATVAPAPDPAAQALNAEGKQLYRDRRWEEARTRYRAAASKDPTFHAPSLNAACALARQERFAAAADEAAALVQRAYVPWAREVLEAADLAALHVRPEMAGLR
jgi:hypothetical protein